MKEHLITTKIPTAVLSLLRVIAAHTKEKQYAVLMRLVMDEFRKLKLREPKQ